MELDDETLDGHWSTNSNTGMDFFIINDAIFSKLCILGEDVEPCFEGSSITAPEVSKHFTKMDDDFKKTLFTMMQDLKQALKGGYKMELEDENVVETEVTTEVASEQENVETPNTETVETAGVNEEVATEEPSIDNTNNSINAETESNEVENATENAEETTVEESKDYTLLEEELNNLKASYAEMEQKYQELVTFKEAVDNEKKDALINSFYMLSDEDKRDVIENKSKYSLDEIEAKLSVICVRKKVNFDLDNSNKNEDTVEEVVDNKEVTTYNLNETESTNIPAWLKALKNTRDSKE